MSPNALVRAFTSLQRVDGMAAEAIVEQSMNGTKEIDESDLRVYLDKWDRKYWATYKVLDILQKVFYRSNPAREAFV